MDIIPFSQIPFDIDFSKGIFIHPSNSSYGIGASIYDEQAYHKIFSIKGRSADKPFFITVSSYQDISKIAVKDSRVIEYIDKYPDTTFTFILQASRLLPSYINPGISTIGVQVASGKLKRLSDIFGVPIFGTSANLSGKSNIYTSQGIIDNFCSYKGITFLDAGDLEKKEVSTIIDLTTPVPKILRGNLS